MKVWMENDPIWSKILGVNFRSGSLNVYVSGDHQLFGQDISPDFVRKTGHLNALQCVVHWGDVCRDGFVVRTELNCPLGTPAPQPNTMFEILAEDLGTGLDESAVEIEFDSAQLKRYPLSNA
jgi:hypothetical protein